MRYHVEAIIEEAAYNRTVDRFNAFERQAMKAPSLIKTGVGAGFALGLITGFLLKKLWDDNKDYIL